MAVSQSTWSNRAAVAVAGQLGDSKPRTVESFEASEDIGFGLAVVRTATAGQVQTAAGTGANSAPYTANNFVGISLRSPEVRIEQQPTSASDATVYKSGDMVSVLTRGTVWVEAAAAVSVGQDVTFNASGALSSAAAGNVQRTIPGATWETATTAAGQLARVRISDYRLGA